MPEILFVKTSSLGDVIHHMPAITDARKNFPNAKISWMVEEAYVPLAKLHPGVNDVIPVAIRRWRKAILKFSTVSKTWNEVSRLRAKLFGFDFIYELKSNRSFDIGLCHFAWLKLITEIEVEC